MTMLQTNSKIDPEVLMHDHVTKAPRLSPRNLWLKSLMFGADSTCRFSQNLKIPDHRVLRKADPISKSDSLA